VNVKDANAPLAENVHEVGVEITAAEVGLEIPYGGMELQAGEIVPTSAGA
jgi:hypothetical protein